mgnify:CR=1 FL=1
MAFALLAVFQVGWGALVLTRPRRWLAAVGAMGNAVALGILHGGDRGSLNLRGAYLEVFGDLVGSVLTISEIAKAASVEEAIVDSVSQVQGAFSFLMLTKDHLVAVRDPHGFRPLALGRLGESYVVCSETCAMDLIGASYSQNGTESLMLGVTTYITTDLASVPLLWILPLALYVGTFIIAFAFVDGGWRWVVINAPGKRQKALPTRCWRRCT